MLRTEDDPAVVVLGDDVLLHERDGDGTDGDERTAVVALEKRRPPVGVLLALAAGLLALIAFDSVGTEDEAPPESTITSTTVVPAPTPASSMDGFDAEIRLLVSADGEPAQLMQWSAGSHRPDASMLVELEDPSFDRSGRYVAGLADSSANRGSVLWVGPVGGELEPVATRVGSFAWHDRSTGRIAWTEIDADETMSLYTSDISEADRFRLVSEIEPGRLRRYGPWGFAMSVPGDAYRTAMLNLLGDPVDLVDGYPVGTDRSGEIVFSGGMVSRTYGYRSLWFADGTRMVRLRDLEPGDAAYELRAAPGGDHLSVQVNHGGLFVGVESSTVLVLDDDGQVVHTEGTLERPTGVQWSPDGRHLVLVGPSDDGAEVVLVEVATGRTAELRVPGVPPGADLSVTDLSVVDGSSGS
ncbi:MAG: hypothetical protein S0880_16285 [Actinomycetota bacterium]|nr:hypothetical protein [Actinomycetota bacterium]